MNSPESTTTSSSLSLRSCKCGEDLAKDLCCPNTQKTKKSNSLTSLAQNFRRGRTLNFTTKRVRKNSRQQKENVTSSSSSSPACSGSKKSPKWVMKFNCTKKERKCTTTTTTTNTSSTVEDPRQMKCCVCTCYRRTDEHHLGAGVVFEQQQPPHHENNASEDAPETQSIETDLDESRDEPENSSLDESIQEISDDSTAARTTPVIYGNIASSNSIVLEPEPESPFLSWIKEVDILEDCDEHARLQRAREIAEGVEAPANFRPFKHLQVLCPSDPDQLLDGSFTNARRLQIVCPPNLTVTVDSLRSLFQSNVTLRSCPLDTITGCHTQVDYIHCLVPDLLNITKCSFYWGKMDRYEAERLLDGKPEGTFLLRDSAQEEFLFSVSFRKYTRSLHARIEQWNHKFSFDSHDPSVFASDTVCGLIEHYKDPSSCMFFEPMLTLPLHRNFTFSLQHLCRAVITSRLNYDSVNQLQLPKSLKSYLKEYHYRQKIRVNRFDDDMPWIDLRPLDRDSPYN